MDFYLYKTTSDKNVVDKVLTNEKKITGDTNNDFDILSPELKFKGVVTDYNYCYIPKFNRYYFIDNISVFRKNLTIMTLQCDVLMTYKEALKKVIATNVESENYNAYDSDNSYHTEVKETYTKKEFQNNFNENGTLILISR